MKRHLLLATPLVLTNPPFLRGQDPAAGAAFLNVVNLVALREPTTIDLGGFRLNGGEPVAPGETSGLLAIVPGSHAFTLENPAAKPRSLTLTLPLEAGKAYAVICYDETRETRDGRRESKLRCNFLVEGDEEGARRTVVSLLQDPLVGIELSGAPVTLVPRQAHKAAIKEGDEIVVSHKGRDLATIAIEKPAHYLGFLYEDPETGEVGLSLIVNEKLEYQPPLESDGDEGEEGGEGGGPEE